MSGLKGEDEAWIHGLRGCVKTRSVLLPTADFKLVLSILVSKATIWAEYGVKI